MTARNTKIVCEQCDLLVSIPKVSGSWIGICPRCHNKLYHYHTEPVLYSLCFALATLVLMFSADFLPFIGISTQGISNQVTLLAYNNVLFAEHYGLVSTLILLFMQILPIVILFIIIFLDVALLLRRYPKIAPYCLKIYEWCVSWCMLDVFLLAVLISLVKIVALVDVVYGAGFWCFLLYVILFIFAVSYFDKYLMWDYFLPPPQLKREPKTGIPATNQLFMGCYVCGYIADVTCQHGHCLRCGSKLQDKTQGAMSRCIALLIAATIMYIPANMYPMMITGYLGSNEYSTIIDGVILLWHMKSYFVALVIVIASVFIPVVKILLLFFLCYKVHRLQKARSRRALTFVYRIVEFIGKWSMVDVFVVAIMSTIVRVGNLMVIAPGTAMYYFSSVVILTMLAARQFEAKLLWQKRKIYES